MAVNKQEPVPGLTDLTDIREDSKGQLLATEDRSGVLDVSTRWI